MAINFPTGLDNFTDYVDGTTVMIAATLNNMQLGIEANQAKIGIDGSAVTSSHDYKLANIMTPAAYVGGESVTFANGLIMKMGAFTPTSNPDTVTFGVAFPTAIISLSVTSHDNTQSGFFVQAFSATAFTGIGAISQPTTYLWIAIGY